MSSTANFVAVDLGASSGRLMVGQWDGRAFSLEELHRFPNQGVRMAGSLHWDIAKIWAEIQDGLRRYGTKYGASPASIGVDAWGVDFALLNRSGAIVENPFHYRDSRTDGMPRRAFDVVPEKVVFSQTGVQTMQINTLFQLYSMVLAGDPKLQDAETLQMVPDLLSYFLDGTKSAEASIASTTQMYKPREQSWAHDLLRTLAIPTDLLPPVVPSGTIRSSVLPAVLRDTGLQQTFPVVAVASHDTASAVAAIPNLDEHSAFISSGTWSVMGIEIDDPITTDAALEHGFTNEIGAGGSILFMKNITGLWILQECLRCWTESGQAYSWDDIVTAASQAKPLRCFINPNAADFLAPLNMPETIRAYCSSSGQPVPQTVGEIARCCFEGLSLKYRSVLESLEALTARKMHTLRIVGGGSLNKFLCQMSADACNCTVVCGPVEAAALGNVMIQAIATGHLNDMQSGRAAIAASIPCSVYEPHTSDAWHQAYERFERLLRAGR